MRRPVPTGLAVAALGVVFGDIGTSPLYTLKTCFTSANAAPTAQNAVGIVSLLIWTLFFVVCIKYVTILMRIDHDGEGGILALLARAEPPRILGVPLRIDWILWVAVIGGAMIIYMETPRLDPILAACGAAALNIDKDTTSFVYANPVIVGKRRARLPRWQRRLFELMQRNSRTLPTLLEIKANRQIQVGVEVAV